jgi:hypothetical protein
MPTVTTETKVATEVKLSPQLRRKLLTELRTYAGLKVQIDALDHAMKIAKGKVESVLGEVGEPNLSIDGFKTQIISAKGSTKLDPQKLVALGVSTAIIDKATVTGPPKAPYLRIDVPGDKSNGHY